MKMHKVGTINNKPIQSIWNAMDSWIYIKN